MVKLSNGSNYKALKLFDIFPGIYMTSLDGHGFSVTILNVDDETILEYLDYPTNAPGWINSTNINLNPQFSQIKMNSKSDLTDIEKSGVNHDPEKLRKIIENLSKAMFESESILNKLDAFAGDGDCGSTFSMAAKSIQTSMPKLTFSHPQTLLRQLAIIFEQTVGGTSGALYALMLSSTSTVFGNEEVSSKVCQIGLEKANESVQIYGGARPGDRTMIDALDAAVQTLKSCRIEETKLKWKKAAAEIAAQETSKQTASVGRASYTSAEAQTHPDAGATAIAIWLKTIFEAVYE
ncbi:unnamed protein product [Caenorhabditis angaria]|uniref:Triokinase/FMN cyclase n=1 Tax=Caenorhabditis angaria TaxID=860376 RepID=A0A9P1IVL2_9PELO|nr:unnamed protein product [Caenorhabditis angaria]